MGQVTPKPPPFWEKPLASLDRAEWEALCDGCGKCCAHKLEDEDTGAVVATNIGCRLLDLHSAQCKDYRRRRLYVPDCIRLTLRDVDRFAWLPPTCAYVLRADGQPLPDWHYLLTGDRESVHEAGASIRGRLISEDHAGDFEDHILPEPL